MGRGGPRVAGRELGETERALPQHAPDRFPYAARLHRRRTHRVDAAVVRVDVCAPYVARVRTDARQLEELVRPVAKRGGTAPVTRPALEQRAVEQNVGERRLVALVERRTLRKLEIAASAGEVVDVAEPLAELERDPRVDGRRRRRCVELELERPCRRLAVETVAEEEVGAHSCRQRSCDQRRVCIRVSPQDLERPARRFGCSRQVARRRVHGDRGEQACAQERVGRFR